MSEILFTLAYLVSAALFIFGLKQLSGVRTSRRGNMLSSAGMLVAIVTTLIDLGKVDYTWVIAGLAVGTAIGAVLAVRVAMTSMPELVAFFNGMGGLASTGVALSVLFHLIGTRDPEAAANLAADASRGLPWGISISASIAVGALTFTGSVIAYSKLAGKLLGMKFRGDPILLPARHVLNAALVLGAVALAYWLCSGVETNTQHMLACVGLTAISLVLGVMLVIPIGGADMPVVISLLNSYSGVAAAMTGFVLGSDLLIIAGSLVGASGLILTRIMCKAMNRSLANVLFGGFGQEGGGPTGSSGYTNVKSATPEEAAMIMESATSVIFVPGYGLAVAQAQHALRELANLFEARGATVRYAIHPVAGRMPGHMNVLLAEANVPYEELVEMDDINPEFKNTDIAIIVGANDVVNPVARNDKTSPIYGMPILNVDEARTVFVIKRSLSPGFAGIDNPLFEADNAMMIFSDAKVAVTQLVEELKQA